MVINNKLGIIHFIYVFVEILFGTVQDQVGLGESEGLPEACYHGDKAYSGEGRLSS